MYHPQSVKEFLSQPRPQTSIKPRNSDLISYLMDNVDELMSFAFVNDPTTISSKALLVLSQNNHKLLTSATQCRFFKVYPRELFEYQTEVSEYAISSFAQFLDNVIRYHIAEIPFINKFIPLANIPAVKSLLMLCVKTCPQSLRDSNFISSVVACITHEYSSVSKRTSFIVSLFQLLIVSAQAPLLSIFVSDSTTLQDLLETFICYDCQIATAQYTLLFYVCNYDNSPQLYKIIPFAVETLLNNKLTQTEVSAIRFLDKLIQSNPDTVNQYDFTDLITSLSERFHNFPNHSIGLSAITSFFTTSIQNSQLAPLVASAFLPEIRLALDSRSHVTQHAFANQFAKQLESIPVLNPLQIELPQCVEVY